MSLDSSDTIIAVMGMTGAGKSSFVKQVSGRKDIIIGHKMSSATEYVTPYKFQYAGTNFILVDTPGFDDSRYTDNDVADRILEWLWQSMKRGQKLSGIIYVHRISDPRMQGTALSNMNMFRRLCGPDCFPNVVLATSFWSEVDLTEGARRERELWETDELWGQLVKRGSRVVRIGLDHKSDQRLLLRIAQNKKVVFQAQQEMPDGSQNCETSATGEASGNLSGWRQYFDAQLKAEEENCHRQLEEMKQRAEEQLRAENTFFREERHAQKRARKIYEADNVASKEDDEKFASQQARLNRICEAHKVENDRLEKFKQAAQKYYNEYKCTRTRRALEVTCDNCMRRFKHHRRKYYHCCHCHNDNFDHCVDCGPRCEGSDHPPMRLCGGAK